MTAPVIPLYSGTVPNRNQSANDFADNADEWLAYQAPLADDYNGLAIYLDNLAIDVDADAVAAAASAAAAAESESVALGAANFKGIWANLTGALNIPASVEHEGAVYLLLNNLADVTLSEPSVTADWLNITGQKYVTPVAGAELSTVLINRLKTSDTFKYPVAATIQEGISITVAILEVDKGITPQIDLQGGDSAKDGINTVTDNVIYSAGFAGLDDTVSNGVDTWEF